jgi:hypothetical protein
MIILVRSMAIVSTCPFRGQVQFQPIDILIIAGRNRQGNASPKSKARAFERADFFAGNIALTAIS